MTSTVFIFSQKVLEHYFTYKFLSEILDIIIKIQYENGSNIPYAKIYVKIGFDNINFFAKVKTNGYIKRSEIDAVQIFFKNLGKRDKNSEKEYIEYNQKIISARAQRYYSDYNEIKKSRFMCGIASGLMIIILFI